MTYHILEEPDGPAYQQVSLVLQDGKREVVFLDSLSWKHRSEFILSGSPCGWWRWPLDLLIHIATQSCRSLHSPPHGSHCGAKLFQHSHPCNNTKHYRPEWPFLSANVHGSSEHIFLSPLFLSPLFPSIMFLTIKGEMRWKWQWKIFFICKQ